MTLQNRGEGFEFPPLPEKQGKLFTERGQKVTVETVLNSPEFYVLPCLKAATIILPAQDDAA